MKTMIVIPARLASTRLSEKLLLRVADKSILQHTYEAASRSTLSDEVIVAADDPRLVAEVDSFGGQAQLTSVDCASGTDRIAEIALRHENIGIFINVQGDEPEIDPATIDAVGQLLANHPEADIATAACPIRDQATLTDPSVVKAVMDANQRAITFSRAVIPYSRDGLTPELLSRETPVYWQHIGLYAYRREFLLWFASQPAGRLEQIEKLEQLRALEAGKQILVQPVTTSAPGIDTLADYRAFQERMS